MKYLGTLRKTWATRMRLNIAVYYTYIRDPVPTACQKKTGKVKAKKIPHTSDYQ